MNARNMALPAGKRCADCGLLRAGDADGLCPHCRLRRMLRNGLRHVDDNYAATWVMLATIASALLLTLLLGGGISQNGLV
ncbi:hypothetical protein E6C76_11110 [Pseudothauera nasutitermitis]|uniref:Uncharacterized protein n=1 Tax=Pseudothauera nasutitermitis TaxID=2565930 RepID=A0A4S4AX42_9RHOO|nr:hypothetical protein [Pseudothauera nasutitermitis]THF64604.1 hypothetical protein E6C76_11110 [Pseudothauera nasutitermitis]